MTVRPATRRVAQNLRAIRKHQRLTLDEVCERLRPYNINLGKSSLSKIENGKTGINVDLLCALADILNVDVGRLFQSPEFIEQRRTELLSSIDGLYGGSSQ